MVSLKYFVSECRTFGENVKVEIDLSNHATKANLKNSTGADTSKFAKTFHLSNLTS